MLAGLLLTPSELFAEKYNGKKVIPVSHPPRVPSLYSINFYLDENTGDYAITPSSDITGLNITITGNGLTYLDTTVSLSFGQSYTDCLDYLGVGTYILTLSTIDGVIDQYEITVEDD
ncbi:MAG: hypothetical protein J6Y78_01650 [Paludibacteraceae bacterium]|nr:hypothetical protein [Paludibacteraceae bacterium]